MSHLKLAIVQFDPEWENAPANRRRLDRMLQAIESPIDICVLPEMFSTGFTMNAASVAESMDGPTIGWMAETAGRMKAVLMGSVVVSEGGRFYNRLIWMRPDGGLSYADKRHLFRMMGEDRVYTPGTTVLEVELNGWRIRGYVCYDLRFPVWMRNTLPHAHLAVVVASWPKARRNVWQHLLIARAIENQMAVVGVNRVGVDGSGLAFSGDSMVIDATGDILGRWSESPLVATIGLERKHIEDFRKDFPAWMDADAFRLQQ
uniref:Omega-amidase YafV n=1 Tax=Desulfatirhabdium butyrativorans TaxID=340467 RepID=A0A7C4MT49_9BACT